MHGGRLQIIEWARAGYLPAAHTAEAIDTASPGPDGDAWRRFVSGVTLWVGALALAAGVIFFFAYNWDSMGRLTKLALVQAIWLAAVATTWFQGLDKPAGGAALMASVLLTGAVFAVFGQVYQTGADPYQLFAAWAALIVPWALIGRLAVLWLIWIALVNLAVVLYAQVNPGWLDIAFGLVDVTWVLFGFNTVALVVWEWLAIGWVPWLRASWARRLLAFASGWCASLLAFWAVIGELPDAGLATLAYVAWMGLAFWYYRYRDLDLFVLAAGILSAIVIVAAGLTRALMDAGGDEAAMLFIALVVIGLSASGALWLKRLQAQAES